MNPSVVQWIIGVSLIIGPAVAVAAVAIGVFGYSPEKAQGIRSAEEVPNTVVEEVRHLLVRRPENFNHDRLDRHPAYLSLHAAVWCYAWCIFGGAPITSNLATLGSGSRMTMAVCFLVGSSLVLSGSAMGARFGRWRFMPSIHDNMTSPRLSDDIRLPYTFGGAGMFAISISMAIYASTSFKSTLGSLGGWITGWSAVMCAIMLVMYFSRVRQYEKARKATVAEAVANLAARRGPRASG
jgi:hypothetical protein